MFDQRSGQWGHEGLGLGHNDWVVEEADQGEEEEEYHHWEGGRQVRD